MNKKRVSSVPCLVLGCFLSYQRPVVLGGSAALASLHPSNKVREPATNTYILLKITLVMSVAFDMPPSKLTCHGQLWTADHLLWAAKSHLKGRFKSSTNSLFSAMLACLVLVFMVR